MMKTMTFITSINSKLEVPTQTQYTKSMKNKIDTRTDFQILGITFLPYPAPCDGDIVAEILGDDQYDIIFLDSGIVCKNDRVDEIKKAIEESLADLE